MTITPIAPILTSTPGSDVLPPLTGGFAINEVALRGLSPSDREKFARFGCGPAVAPPHLCIDQAFQSWARSQPDAVALTHGSRSLTYAALDELSTRLAHRLMDRGIGRGDNVCLFLRRSPELVVGLLAVLKVGAAYVPQDAKVAPQPVLRHVVEATGSSVVLTSRDWCDAVPEVAGTDVLVIDADEPIATRPAPVPSIERSPDDPCFILFTSGTTGNPNGVQVTHRNVCNIVLTEPGNLGMAPGKTVAQILSISFDMSAWEILGALGNGASLCMREKRILDAASQSNIIIATPSVLGTIDPDHCPRVETVAVAGEPCPVPLADAWSRVGRFYNSCGPTETTIINTAQEYSPDHQLTIGRPTPNNTVYVLGDNLEPLPIGEVGEMWAGGDCVTAGYLGNPALTDERYRPDPFLGRGRMMFRTRDLGRWTESGELEHHGRTDDQVKVRGFRVELDSVSTVLEETPGCTSAVTLKYDDRTLVAFVQPAFVDAVDARARVASALPYYACPAVVQALPELPRTPRGKVDKRRLLELAADLCAAELRTVAS